MRNEFDHLDAPEGQEPSLDLGKILQFLRRRRWPILIATLIGLIPAAILPFRKPSVYQATASVAIQPKPEVMEIGADLIGPGGRQDVVSQMESLIRSGAVLGRIVDQMPQPAVAPAEGLGFLTRTLVKLGLESEGAAAPSRAQIRQMMIESLQTRIEIEGDGGDSILRISTHGPDPANVTFLANAVADSLVAYRREQHTEASRNALSWLNEQIAELRTRIDRRQQAVDTLVKETGISPQENLGTKRVQIETQISTAELELLVKQRRTGELRSKLRTRSQTAAQTQETQRAMDQYREAKTALAAAKLTYKETHPQVRRLEAIVQSLAGKLDPSLVSASTGGEADEAERRLLESEASALEARVAGLRNSLQALASSPEADTEALSRYERLSREVVLDEQMLEVLLKRHNETLLNAATEHPGVHVLDYAVPPGGPMPTKRLLVFLFCVGAAAGFGGAIGIGLELLDRRVREPEDVTKLLGVPMLALIPLSTQNGVQPERQCAQAAGEPASEAYRNLRTSLLFATNRSELSTLLVTSAVAGEGKTTVSANLAASFAMMGRKVLLVDADMRRARVHRVFGLPRSPGLSEVLTGAARIEDALRRPEGVEFDVLSAGAAPDNPSELITSPRRDLLFARIRNQYDLVIVDSPVLLAVSDALILASDSDATLLVHKLGSVDRRALNRLRSDLQRAGANVLGIVFNHVDSGDPYLYPAYMESPYLEDPAGGRSWLRRRGARSS